MLLCEHDPVYTFGLRQKDYAEEAKRLQQLGAEVFKVCIIENYVIVGHCHSSPLEMNSIK